MLEKILEAILDPQPKSAAHGVHQAPPDPLSWLDDVFNNGWMAQGAFGDGAFLDETSIYGNNLDWFPNNGFA